MNARSLRSLSLVTVCSLLLLAAPHAQAAAPAASIAAVQYPAWLERNGQREPLAPGDTVRTNDSLISGPNARILVILRDGSEIRLGGGSQFLLEKLQVSSSPAGTDVNASLKLLQGFFRYTSSALGKLSGKRKIDLQVKTATIGIRGTDYWAMTDAEHDAVCVFEGKVEVATQDQGAILLDQPTAFWARHFAQAPAPAGIASPPELARFIASVEPGAGSGVAIIDGRWRVVAAAETALATAREISKTLRQAGYPALIVKADGRHEVRINAFATRADAEAVLKVLGSQPGLSGSNAKVIATR